MTQAARTLGLTVFSCTRKGKKLFRLLNAAFTDYRVLDDFGVVKLQCTGSFVKSTTAGRALADIAAFIEEKAVYSDVGMVVPEVFLLYRSRIVDYTSVLDFSQIRTLLSIELEGLEPDEPVVALLHPRKS